MAQNPASLFAMLIDATYYLNAHPDAASSGLGATEHYLRSGWTLGYDPSPYFSTTGYLAANPDVAAAGVNPLLHYATSGAQEGRSPSVLFDSSFYLAHNPDVAASGSNPLLHFMQYGVHEGRDPNAFFSVSGYLAANPDVAASGTDPYAHYLTFGWHEGRDPSPHFDTSWYLEQNPDVAAAGVNPLQHYLTFGWHEGRDPSPHFDTSWYLEQNPDVAAAGVNPLGHYLQFGIHEHRVAVAPSLSVSTLVANEGTVVTYTFSAPGMPAGTPFGYVLHGVQADDVLEARTGTATLDSEGRATVSFTLAADATTEGTETMQLSIGGRLGSVVISDTSQTQTAFFLTAATDSIAGSIYDDTFTATVAGGFASTDRIDGGDGLDTLDVTDTAGFSLAALPILVNVEAAVIASSAGSIQLDTTAWSGLERLQVHGNGGNNAITVGAGTRVLADFVNVGAAGTTINGGTGVTLILAGSTTGGATIGSVTAPSGAISVNNTSGGAVAMGAIAVTGGSSVSIVQAATNAVGTTTTMGEVTVTGTAATTAVSVTAAARATASGDVAGVITNSVAITDVNHASACLSGTIASVTVANYSTLAIGGNALTTLSLTGGSGNVIIDNSGLTTPTNRALAVTLDGLTGGTMDDADIYTTLNATTAGHNSSLANITFGALTSLNIDGTHRLTLTSTAGMTMLQTVAVRDAAGLTADLSSQTSLTSIDTSATTGTSVITLNAGRASFTGGAGADRVTHASGIIDHAVSLGAGDDSLNLGSLSSTPGASLSGGVGTDTLIMQASLAATASVSNAFAEVVTGFERLVLNGATNQTVDLAMLGIPDYVSTSGGNGLTLSNLANGGTLALTGAGTAYTISNTAFTAGTDDRVHVILQDGSGAGVAFASTGITASRVEHIDVTVLDTQATPTGTFNDSLTLLGNSAHSITIGGNAGLTLTATSTALTSVDASGIIFGGFTWTSGALANASSVHGSASGTNTVNVTAANQAVSYVGGSGNDVMTAANGQAHVIDLGGGNNSFVGGSGHVSVTAGDGADTVVLTSGNNTVSLGNGTNAFTATSGNNTYVGGAGTDIVTLGGGMNHVTLGAGSDVVSLTASGANLNVYTTIADLDAGDTIVFADLGTETFNGTKMVLGRHAVFQDYANAVVTAGGNASVNGAFGWFQFGGDTYLVESRHDGSGNNAEFINGVDMIVELTGLVDLSAASVTGNAFSFGII
ncbi:MAG: calcium-binding protein [Acetobacteraceae bacterium]|nr:MAG: calcium-binding protein [Acetobacteraceae bacterium]